jgi:hypothetical protein
MESRGLPDTSTWGATRHFHFALTPKTRAGEGLGPDHASRSDRRRAATALQHAPLREAPPLPSRLAPPTRRGNFVDGVLGALPLRLVPRARDTRGLGPPARRGSRSGGPRGANGAPPDGPSRGADRASARRLRAPSHGSSNNAIARTLGIDVKTVQTHRAQVNAKLGVRSPAELVRFAATHGLLGVQRDATEGPAPVFNLAELERRAIAAALRATGGNRHRAAGLLGFSPSSLYNKMEPPPAPGPSSPRTAARASAPPKKRSRLAKASPRGSARPNASRTIVAAGAATESAQLPLPRLGEESIVLRSTHTTSRARRTQSRLARSIASGRCRRRCTSVIGRSRSGEAIARPPANPPRPAWCPAKESLSSSRRTGRRRSPSDVRVPSATSCTRFHRAVAATGTS